jgi:hypothetical protein
MANEQGFRNEENGTYCIARRASNGHIESWTGTGWTPDSDFAKIFPSQKELQEYLDQNPTLAGETNLRVLKTGNI